MIRVFSHLNVTRNFPTPPTMVNIRFCDRMKITQETSMSLANKLDLTDTNNEIQLQDAQRRGEP